MNHRPPLALITTPLAKRPVLLLGFTADEVQALALRWNGVAAHDATWTAEDSERWEKLSKWTVPKGAKPEDGKEQ